MRRWIVLLAKLYPRAWRERYGVEFDALMEDVPPDWRELTDILGGAVKLQMQSETAYLKLIGAMALLGVIVSAGLSFVAPGRYVSSALLRVTLPREAAASQTTEPLDMMQQEILSRGSLAELITRPSLDLYRGERQRKPMEDVIERMRRDIQIRRVPSADGNGFALSVSFAYPNRFKALAVVRQLTEKFVDVNLLVNQNRVNLFRAAWHENAPPGATVRVDQAASDPLTGEPHLLEFLAWGLIAGLLLGTLASSVVRRPKRALQLAAFGIAGCALAGAASFLFPAQYVSSAVMRVTPPIDPKRWYAGRVEVPVAERLQEWEKAVLSRENLAQMINGYCRQFYKEQLASTPLDEIVTNMRDRDLRIQMVGLSAFRISFTADDGRKAQAVVRGLVTGFTEQNIKEVRARGIREGAEVRMMEEHKIGDNVEVLDPASLPETPVSPNRLVAAAIGAAAGLLFGVMALCLRYPIWSPHISSTSIASRHP